MTTGKLISICFASTILAGGLAVQSAAADTEAADTQVDFHDSATLVTTLMQDDQVDLDSAEADLKAAVEAEETARLELDSAETDAEKEAAQARLDEASAARIEAENEFDVARQSYDDELAQVQTDVSNLSEEQLVALNRSLQNVRSNGLVVNLDAEQVAEVIDGDYDAHDITALTKAYEEEAKFEGFASRFEAKAEETGNDKFLDQAERMHDRADGQKSKFLAKIGDETADLSDDEVAEADMDVDVDADIEAEARAEASIGTSAAREEARQTAADAKQAGLETAREARESARDAAQDARETARDAAQDARETARNAAKDARDTARDAAKDARETARDAAQDARDNAREAARDARAEARETARDAVRGL